MTSTFPLDLRAARQKAGFTQRDIADLLDAHQSFISDLECGRAEPDLRQILALQIIYGRSFESFFAEAMEEAKAQLRQRLPLLSTKVRARAGAFNRPSSIERLHERIAVIEL